MSLGIGLNLTLSGGGFIELIPNPTMEADSGWLDNGTPTTHERSAAQAHNGTYSRHVVGDAADDGCYSDPVFSVLSGKTYVCEAWVYPVSGAVRMKRLLGPLAGDAINSVGTGAWEKLRLVLVAGSSGSERMSFFCYAAAAEFYIDDVTLRLQ